MVFRHQLGLRALQRAAISREANHGVPSANEYNRLVHGVLSVTPEVETLIPQYANLSLAERHHLTHLKRFATLSWEGYADFNQLVDFMRMSVTDVPYNSPTGAISGIPDSGAHIWNFTSRTRTTNRQSSYTFEYGDNTQAFQIKYVMATEWELSAAMGEAVSFSVSMFGNDLEDIISTTAPTDGRNLALPYYIKTRDLDTSADSMDWIFKPQFCISQRSQLYVDDSWISIGTTSLRRLGGYLRAWSFSSSSGLERFGNKRGDINYNKHSESPRSASLSLSFAADRSKEGTVARIDVLNGGRGYVTAPIVNLTSEDGDTAYARAQVSNGAVTSIIVTEAGSGYTSPPKVTIGSPGSGASAVAVLNYGFAWDQFEKWRSGEMQAIRIRVLGDVIPNSMLRHQLIIDANVVFDDNPEIFTDDEGVSLVTLTGHVYSDQIDNSVVVDANRVRTDYVEPAINEPRWPAPVGLKSGNDFRIMLVNTRSN